MEFEELDFFINEVFIAFKEFRKKNRHDFSFGCRKERKIF